MSAGTTRHSLKSAIYYGAVSHRRRGKAKHRFHYSIYMLFLDLDELAKLRLRPLLGINRPSWLTFRHRDYLDGRGENLKQRVLDTVERNLGIRLDGSVRLLTHVRSLGYVFNPVSFYYCYAASGELRAIVAEITNTPWGERHCYVVPAPEAETEISFDKRFHVSPFFPMEQRYHWKLSDPGQSLRVEMTNKQEGRAVFGATLMLRRRALTRKNLVKTLLRQPLMTWRVHGAIYWQALLLWVKGASFFTHPRKRDSTPNGAAPEGAICPVHRRNRVTQDSIALPMTPKF